jgi:hypothetical protein
MDARRLRRTVFGCGLLLGVGLAAPEAATATKVPFTSGAWVLRNAEIAPHLGRSALAGTAFLKDVAIENGVVEVDIAASGARSYPGILFRMRSEQENERVYLRPHRAGLYPDALQYTPTFNGIAGWQLYSGDGYTALVSLARDEWVHLKVEFSGTQARVFLGDTTRPALVIDDLERVAASGTVGVMGPHDGTAYFSDFRYRTDDHLSFEPSPPAETPPGTILQWEISPVYGLDQADLDRSPYEQGLGAIAWLPVTAEPSGLVDVARHRTPLAGGGGIVLAQTTLTADTPRRLKLQFGYSDNVSIYLNGVPLFSGESAYQLRDPSFLGIIGLNDAVYLPLRRGENDLLLAVAETFGGWGFMARDGEATFRDARVEEVWRTDAVFLTPESVAYDPQRRVLYVSNLDAAGTAGAIGGQFISEVGLDGAIHAVRWATGLSHPTGLAVRDTTLYAVERGGIALIDTRTGRITASIPLPGSRFPNDIAIGDDGAIYVSDSGRSAIYRVVGGQVELWLEGDAVGEPNGLWAGAREVVFGNSGDARLKSADPATGEVRTIARLTPGILDGLRPDRAGDYLVSHWDGRIYRVRAAGEIEKLLDTSVSGERTADFEYVAGPSLIVVPTFDGNRLVAYRLRTS